MRGLVRSKNLEQDTYSVGWATESVRIWVSPLAVVNWSGRWMTSALSARALQRAARSGSAMQASQPPGARVGLGFLASCSRQGQGPESLQKPQSSHIALSMSIFEPVQSTWLLVVLGPLLKVPLLHWAVMSISCSA